MIRPRDLGNTPTEWLELQQELTQWTPLQWQIYGEQIEHEERFYGTKNHADGLRSGGSGDCSLNTVTLSRGNLR